MHAPCRIAVLVSGLLALACSGVEDRPPSVILIVIDTLRADAVSAYGAAEGTTPTLDGLAARGVVYRNALSPSSWTLPSHASLFTGVGVDRHGVGMPGRQLLVPANLVTVAQRLRAAGYQTVAMSENLLISHTFNQLQGFEYRVVPRVLKKGMRDMPLNTHFEPDLRLEMDAWLRQRDRDRPFFLFVNIFDAHSPYTVRDENPWVPATATRAEMERFAAHPEQEICNALPSQRDLEILEGLYLGDVAAADRKLKMIFDKVSAELGDRPVIRIVTSDHGELFGEGALLGHEFSVHQGALHIPLIVEGVPGASPAVVHQPVSLLDVAPSILAWTGLEQEPGHEGRILPLESAPLDPTTAAERRFFAAYSDGYVLHAEGWEGLLFFYSKDKPRVPCGKEHKVFGGMASVIRYPYKLQWFERYPDELYDLSWDPDERSELSLNRPELVAELQAEIKDFVRLTNLDGGEPEEPEPMSPEAIESLRALGYID